MMLKIDCQRLFVVISLDSSSSDEPAKIVYEGSDKDVSFVKDRLNNSFGAFGHKFDVLSATPIDLHYAVFSSLKEFDPVVVEGADLVTAYALNIPEGAIS